MESELKNVPDLLQFRVMQDRREQARQDLKGLEETVVRKCENKYDWRICFGFF